MKSNFHLKPSFQPFLSAWHNFDEKQGFTSSASDKAPDHAFLCLRLCMTRENMDLSLIWTPGVEAKLQKSDFHRIFLFIQKTLQTKTDF